VNAKSEEIQAQREDLKALLQENIWKDTNITALHTKMDEQESRIKDLGKQLAEEKRERAEADLQVGNLTSQLREALERATDLQSVVEKLTTELLTSKDQVKELTADLLSTQGELGNVTEQLVAKTAREDETIEQLAAKSVRVTTLEHEVEVLQELLKEARKRPALNETERGKSLTVVPGGHHSFDGHGKYKKHKHCWLGLF